MGLFNLVNKNVIDNIRNIESIEDKHRKHILEVLSQIPKRVPEGWRKIDFAIAGLLYAGFSEVSTEKLICISSQGQSVINCKTGEKKFCDENYDEHDLIACADELGDEMIHIAGIGGGGMCHYSGNGETLQLAAPHYPKEQVIFMPDFKDCFSSPKECRIIFEDYGIRTFGFSKCGNYMIACSSSDLSIFTKISPMKK